MKDLTSQKQVFRLQYFLNKPLSLPVHPTMQKVSIYEIINYWDLTLKFSTMALLRDYNRLSGTNLKNFAGGVITGLGSSILFSSLTAEVAILTTLKNKLSDSILSFNESTKSSNDIMLSNKADVVEQLDIIRKLANTLCGEDESIERLTGFTPNKRGRTRRTFIAPAKIISAINQGVPQQLLITIKASVEGNIGYEVRYVINGVDRIAGVARLRSRSPKFLVSGFPSSVSMQVYLITLGKNNLRSTPSNYVTATAI